MRKIFLLLAFCQHLIAAEVKLAKVIIEPQDNATHDLLLLLDEKHEATSFIRKSDFSETHYPIKDLKSNDVALAKFKGKNVISLSLPDHNETGGTLIIKYLYNGLTMNYKAISLRLAKEGEHWGLYTLPPESHRIHTLNVKSRRIAGLLIGIQRIEYLK